MACKSKVLKIILFILLVWACPSPAPAVTPPIPAHPAQYVVDLAGVLDAGVQARLNAMLKDLEEKTGAQVVVLTLDSLEGEPLESFSHQTAVQWGIGQKGKDNGVLLTVAVKDKKYRIEVGYGLEGTLPDSLVGTLGRQYLVPHFRQGDFAGGISAAVTEIADTIKTGAGGETVHKKKILRTLNLTIILFLVFVLLVVALVVWSERKSLRANRRGAGYDGWGPWFGGGGFGGGWSSGGGDSGGFSGGGGDFGGGGASGDW